MQLKSNLLLPLTTTQFTRLAAGVAALFLVACGEGAPDAGSRDTGGDSNSGASALVIPTATASTSASLESSSLEPGQALAASSSANAESSESAETLTPVQTTAESGITLAAESAMPTAAQQASAESDTLAAESAQQTEKLVDTSVPTGEPATSAALPVPIAAPTNTRNEPPLFGPWVEHRHRLDNVFQRFNGALLWSDVANVQAVLADARATDTRIFLQLGSTQEWGWNFSNNTSTFTLAKWKASVDRFADDPVIKEDIATAIADGTIRGIYLIDEPHHTRWSPSGENHHHIPNSDIDEMARHVKTYWPEARTSVRASARTLISYNREVVDWQYLDESFLMINYRKWATQGQDKTIEAFMEREIAEANNQGLGVIGSVQMLIGAPTSEDEWWPDLANGATPQGKLKVSPIELQAYVSAFFRPRNTQGVAVENGEFRINEVMVFRWDRNNEDDWADPFYSDAMDAIVSEVAGY